MPLDMRFGLGPRFCITKGLGCLCVFTREYTHEIENELDSMGGRLSFLLDPSVAKLQRHFHSGLQELGTDKQFRVQLTPEQRRYADIRDEVIICGCGPYIELWSPEAFEKVENGEDQVEGFERPVVTFQEPDSTGEEDAGVPPAGTE